MRNPWQGWPTWPGTWCCPCGSVVSDEPERTAERDRARDLAVYLEAELARLREGIERLCDWAEMPFTPARPEDAPLDLGEMVEDLRALLGEEPREFVAEPGPGGVNASLVGGRHVRG